MGLKENVILGKLIPAGTGHEANAHLLPEPEPRDELELVASAVNGDSDEPVAEMAEAAEGEAE